MLSPWTSVGWFDVSPKTARDMMREWACCDEAANHQLLIAGAFWTIQIVSMEKCSNLMKNWMQIHCSTCSVILDAMATQYTCSLNVIFGPHWLVQWSHHCSHVSIPILSPWLPGYLDVLSAILIILKMAGLFPDRPCIIYILALRENKLVLYVICSAWYFVHLVLFL